MRPNADMRKKKSMLYKSILQIISGYSFAVSRKFIGLLSFYSENRRENKADLFLVNYALPWYTE